MSLNSVVITGNLVADVELRYTPGGKAVTQLRVAVNNRYKSSDGTNNENTAFMDVDVWGRTAEICAEHLEKGSKVGITGRFRS